jgi:hypothetical protein
VKLLKQQGPPDSIARGVAVGFLTGFLVPFGLQVVAALFFAYLVRGKKIPAVACTWITNHVTVFIFYPAQCYLGSIIMGTPMSFNYFDGIFKNFAKNPSISEFVEMGSEILIPFFLGGAVVGSLTAFIGYFASYGIIVRYRQKKDRKLRMRLSSSTKSEADEKGG